jgi:hypothetical protein
MLQASASARKPQSRLKAMQKSGSKAAAAPEDDGISSLAGLMATKLQLAADEDDEDDDAGAAQDAAACGDACGASSKALQQGAIATKQGQSKRASSAAASSRRVRFAEEAQQDDAAAAADDDAYELLVVPQSLARHAVRRSRLAGLPSGLKAAAPAAAGSSTARKAVAFATAAHSSDSDGDTGDHGAGVATSSMRPAVKSRLGAAGSTAVSAAAIVATQKQQQQQGAWVPSVLLLLDGQVQRLPWESCQGLRQQNMYRCVDIPLCCRACKSCCQCMV